MGTRRGVAAVVLVALVAALGWWVARRPSSDEAPRDARPPGRASPAPAAPAGGAKGVAPLPTRPVLEPALPYAPPPAPPPAPQGLHVTGRVVDAAGKAVAGARVVASSDVNATTFALAD